MIAMVNLRNEKPTKPFDVCIDRSSPLGNIFCMYAEDNRDSVCDKYQFWFDNTILINKQVSSYTELQRILFLYKEYGRLRLFCWCTPKRCHGLTIKIWLENNI